MAPAGEMPGSGTGSEAERFWERLYGAQARRWSGRPNAVLTEVAGPLPPGRALDLGCGEGGDAVWLAERGWHVTAVDVSPTALERAAALARAAGVESRIALERHDLGRSIPAGTFDLVCAQYLHSPIGLPREQILRSAAGAVAGGGLLLVVEHGSVAPWSWDRDHDRRFPTAEEALTTLELDLQAWDTERLESMERRAGGPRGQAATVRDLVIALRRRR